MSRSYRKYPCYRMTLWGKHNKSMKAGKQYANRKIRHKLKNPNIECFNGNYYKSLGIDSWDLYEFKFYETEQDIIGEWEQDQKHFAQGLKSWKTYRPTKEQAIQDWKASYIRK